MKKYVLGSTLILTLGMIIGVLLVSNLSPDIIEGVFAKGKNKIGADNAPTVSSDAMRVLNESFANVSEAVLPSVVSVSVKVKPSKTSKRFGQLEEFFEFFGGKPKSEDNDEEYFTFGSGSGVIISDDGYIVTNNHVIENATEIRVKTTDKKEYIAELVGADPLTDLALLKIKADNLPAAHFTDIKNVRVGEFVIAVGSPLGLTSTVTNGIVSAIGRGQLDMYKDSYAVEYYIQTDAAINPGNSGGGLFNMDGSLVGINTAIATRTGNYMGYGFAIPVDLVESVISDLMDDGRINRGYIGISISSIKDEVEAKAFGIDGVYGVKVEGILENSAAKDAGLKIGDVLLELDGEKLYTANELQSRIVQRRAGDKVELKIKRDGKEIMKTVKLKPRDGEEVFATTGTEEKETDDNSPINFDHLGFSVKPLNDKIRNDYEIEDGVLISDVKRYSIAAERGFYPNGVIIKADKQEVKSPGQLKRILDSKKPGDAVSMQVKYPEVTRVLAVQIPQKEG